MAPALRDKLNAVGLTPLTLDQAQEHDPSELLLIYDSPDQLIAQWRKEQDTPPTLALIENIYEQLSSMSEYIDKCAASWRLDRLDTTSIKRYCHGISPTLDNETVAPEPTPMSSYIILKILQESPLILERYLNLEQKSQLFGLEADSHYLERLQSRSLADLILVDWWLVNQERECSREQATMNLLRAEQVQSDYDELIDKLDSAKTLMNKQNQLSLELLKSHARNMKT